MTSLRASRIWLGTAALGAWGNGDHGDCVRLIHRALDYGINAIDTADSYSNGEAEEIVGKALIDRRDQVFLASKFGYAPSQGGRPITSADVVAAAEASLRRLGTDRLDLYQIHRLRSEDEIEELLVGLHQLVAAGKVAAIGTSMFRSRSLELTQTLARELKVVAPSTEQAPYSLLVREIETDVIDTCARLGIALVTFAPLNGGWLTGKYRGGAIPGESRAATWPVRRVRFDFEREELVHKMEAVEALETVATDLGQPLGHMALAFALTNSAVTAVIVGPRTCDQLEQLVPAFDLRLPSDVMARLDAIVAPGVSLDAEDVLAYRTP